MPRALKWISAVADTFWLHCYGRAMPRLWLGKVTYKKLTLKNEPAREELLAGIRVTCGQIGERKLS